MANTITSDEIWSGLLGKCSVSGISGHTCHTHTQTHADTIDEMNETIKIMTSR